jgi:hypothetical protein
VWGGCKYINVDHTHILYQQRCAEKHSDMANVYSNVATIYHKQKEIFGSIGVLRKIIVYQ